MAPLSRLHIITDTRPGRDAVAVLRAALAAAASTEVTVQVRVEDSVTDREAYGFARTVMSLCTEHGVSCLVNDRLHVALAVGAAGGHVGAEDLPVAAARQVLGPAAVLGVTCRDPASAPAAVAAGASYLGVGPAFDTTTKDDLPAAIGPDGIAAVAAAVPDTPVIAIGGITPARTRSVLAAGAYGVAVVGALSRAVDPGAVVRELLAQVPPGGENFDDHSQRATTASAGRDGGGYGGDRADRPGN